MPTTVLTDTYQLPTQWWNDLSKSNELLLQRNGEPVAKLDEQMRAAALALLDDYTNDPELTIFTTALGGEEFYGVLPEQEG